MIIVINRLNYILENHNIEVDLDLAGDLALLKKNLAKLRKGRHGKGLGDILIEEIDWVGIIIAVSHFTILNFISYLDTK